MKSLSSPQSAAAADPSTGLHVVLKSLKSAALVRLGGEARLRALLDRVAAEAHPHWVRWLGFDPVAGKLMREWIHGFTLRELIDRRGALPVAEVVKLCADLPGALRAMEVAGLEIPRALPAEVFVDFDAEVSDPDAWLGESVLKWPGCALKVSPLQLTAAGRTHDTLPDVEGPVTEVPGSTATEALAGLLYELLGGDAAAATRRHPPRLTAVSEAVNGVLREGLLGEGEAGAVGFWREFCRAAEAKAVSRARAVPAEATQEAVTTVKAQGSVVNGTLLRLHPLRKGALPLHVTARPQVRIGREPGVADVLTRFLPETPANERLTDRLGRVHVLGRRVDGWPCFWDGDGRRASVNGAWLDEVRLDHEAGTCGEAASLLRLGRHYRLAVVCLEEAPVELSADEPERATQDCTVLFSPHEQPLTRLVAWLGRSVGLHLTGHGLAWSPAATQSEAALLHARGGFWLANLSLPRDAMSVDDAPVLRGGAVALGDGQEIAVGAVRYQVRVEL